MKKIISLVIVAFFISCGSGRIMEVVPGDSDIVDDNGRDIYRVDTTLPDIIPVVTDVDVPPGDTDTPPTDVDTPPGDVDVPPTDTDVEPEVCAGCDMNEHNKCGDNEHNEHENDPCEQKILMCHTSHSGQQQTKEVKCKHVQHHLEHGFTIGACDDN